MVLSVPLYAKIVLEALSYSRTWMAAYFGSKYALSLAVSSTRRLVSDKVRLDGIVDKLFGWSRALIWFFKVLLRLYHKFFTGSNSFFNFFPASKIRPPLFPLYINSKWYRFHLLIKLNVVFADIVCYWVAIFSKKDLLFALLFKKVTFQSSQSGSDF